MKITHLGNKEPDAAHQMDHQENNSSGLKHSIDSGIHLDFSH